MRYLKKAKAGKQFSATFTNGERTDSHDASCFFMAMQDKGVGPGDLYAYIKIGKVVDPSHDWKEIERIAKSLGATPWT